MNAQKKVEAGPQSPLALLREPFPAHQISKLPKESRKQVDERKNRTPGCMVWQCPECGNAHHKDAVHLDYVGHAALTDRLLDVDPEWTWEPVAFTEAGLPAFDASGGLWIKLTVCGVTRYGYGHAAAKPNQDPGAREKEVIGDALRNAAMRFGAALDLWHKGVLHGGDDESATDAPALIDDGNAAARSVSAAPAAPPALIDDTQGDLIAMLADEAGRALPDICRAYKIASIRDLTREQGEKLIARLRREVAARESQQDAAA